MQFQPTATNKGVLVLLQPGEGIIAEPGAMTYHDSEIQAETRTGGFMNAIKRKIAGENFLQVRWINKGSRPAKMGMAAQFLSTVMEVVLPQARFSFG